MNETKPAENKMGYMPVPKLLFTMSLPVIISMLVQAFYNVVDSIFVSRISENALTAVSLVFPIQTLLISVASGTGVGINALLSRSLGERNGKKANTCADNGIFLAIASAIGFAILGVSFSGIFIGSQTQDPEISTYGLQYMRIISGLSIGVFMQITLERLLLSTGKTVFTMISQGVGAIINIVLDPILIFGLFGFPRMEVAGAAIATVIGQLVGMCLGIFMNIKWNKEIKLSFRGFRPNGQIIREIYIVGVPSIIMQAIGSVMTYGMNRILITFTSTATAVFGVYFKLNSFVFMPVFGINSGMVPIIAFNYGARNKSRITQTLKLSIYAATAIMLVGIALFWLIPEQLLQLFNASDNMIAIGIPALRIISLSFIFAGFCIIVGSVFQALGNGVYSLIVSVARQLIVILPVAYILGQIGGLEAVWWSIPIAEVVSVTMSAILLKRIYRLKVNPLS